mmetsp:Transcript_15400/g.19984  ORF Transcript_15400/g.19984 Transcript_15400/m.19984 type:complete len:85 (+) Transcript_15400:612-866(+)
MSLLSIHQSTSLIVSTSNIALDLSTISVPSSLLMSTISIGDESPVLETIDVDGGTGSSIISSTSTTSFHPHFGKSEYVFPISYD